MIKERFSRRGFTIIEVVLVLAIAGLIFLMIFVALPALQRSQRDAERRNDVAIVAAAIKQWRVNNKWKKLKTVEIEISEYDDEGRGWGVTPQSAQLVPYLEGQLSQYTTTIGVYDNTNSTGQYRTGEEDIAGHISVNVGRVCPERGMIDGTATLPNGAALDVAIVRFLENGEFYCANTN